VSHHFVTTAASSTTDRPTFEADALGFVIVWSKREPDRLAETCLLVPYEKMIGGRGTKLGLKGFLRFGQHRPGGAPLLAPLEYALLDERISREQFEATSDGDTIAITVTGNCPTFVNGKRIEKAGSATLKKNDLLLLEDSLLLLVVERKRIMPALKYFTTIHPFGKVDCIDTVGEGPAVWALRDLIALAAARLDHVLISGETGTGKEALALGIHRLSERAHRIFNPMNAAAIDEGLLAAEIFGSPANFPNAGMPARDGLLPVADGGTAFMDEIGGISLKIQTALRRVLAARQYHKVGESRMRLLTAAIVAATSAPLSVLDLDFLKRFARIIYVPALRDRKEDIALILRYIILQEAAQYPKALAQFLETGPDGELHPRVSVEFVAGLLRHDLPGNVRDVRNYALLALEQSADSDTIGIPRELEADLARPPRSGTRPASAPTAPRAKPSREEIVAALEEAGSVLGATLILGVPRSTLRAWMKEYGISSKEKAG